MVHRNVNKLETRVTGLDCVFDTNQGVCVCDVLCTLDIVRQMSRRGNRRTSGGTKIVIYRRES